MKDYAVQLICATLVNATIGAFVVIVGLMMGYTIHPFLASALAFPATWWTVIGVAKKQRGNGTQDQARVSVD